MCGRVLYAAFVVVHFNLILSGQPAQRLVIMADGNRENPLLQGNIAMLKSNLAQDVNLTDQHLISISPVLIPASPGEEIVTTLEEGLYKVNALCQDPARTVLLAFVFNNTEGPSAIEVLTMLHQAKSPVKLLSNAYFKTDLADLSESSYPIFTYVKGEVGFRDTAVVKEKKFPVIPVVLGGAAVTTAGIILLVSGGDGDEDECDPVDPSWIVPGDLCSADPPLTLVVTGTQGGVWSGIGVTANGTFDPASGSQTITYTVGEGACRQGRSQLINVSVPDANWNIPKSPCEDETIRLVPVMSGGTWSGPGIVQNPDGSANFLQSNAGTYSVSYTLFIGRCSDTRQQNINVIPDADAAWTLPAPPCAGDAITLVPTGTPGGRWSGDGVTDNGTGSATFTKNEAGFYQVTYTAGTGECQASLTQQIEVLRRPDASWTPPSSPLCIGEEYALQPKGDGGGNWSGNGVTDLGNGTGTFSNANAGTYPVTYTVSAGNCISAVTQNIQVINLADPSWSSPGETCTGESYTLTPTGTPGGSWSGTGITDHGNGTATFAPQQAGTFTVTYTAGSGTCEASLALDITVIETPDAAWTAPSMPLCAGETYELIPSGTQGGTWSGNGVTDHGDGTASFVNGMAGDYVVTYNVANGSCDAALSHTISVIILPDASWVPPPPVCSGDQVNLSPTGTMGGAWTGMDVTDLGDGTAVFAPDEEGIYSITYTIGQGTCQAMVTHEIQVLLTPDAKWTSPGNACAGTSVTLIPEGTPGGTWSGEGVINAGDGTGTFSQGESGIYTITYTVVNGSCQESLSQDIEVIANPDPAWIPPSDLCEDKEVTLLPTGTPGGTWSGPGITDMGDGTALFLAGAPGIFSITYSVIQGICQSSLDQDIEVFPSPVTAWNPPSGLCTGQSVTLTPTGTPGGTWSGNGVTNLGDGTALFTLNEPGVSVVTYKVVLGPCADSTMQQIEVVNLADPGWTPPSNVCIQHEIILVPDGTPGGTWSGPGVTDHGDGTATFLQSSAGTYAVTYTAGQGACAQQLTQNVIVISPGNPAWTPPPGIICPGDIVQLTAPTGNWSGPGVTNFGGGLGKFQSSNPGFFPVTLTVGSGNCTASQTHSLQVGDNTPPVIEFPAEDMTVPCDGNGNISELEEWLDTYGGAEAFDNCSSFIIWENDFFDLSYDCGTAGSVSVVFTAYDEYGNSVTTDAVFTIEDVDPPIIQGMPPDINVSCDAIPGPASITAFDDCSDDVLIEFVELPPGSSCPYEIIRIWTVTDDCGNSISDQQVITVTDHIPPGPLYIPPDIMIECPGPPITCIPPPGEALFMDNCDPDPLVQMTETIEPIPGGLYVMRCWTGTDNCFNVSPVFCQDIYIFTLAPPEAPAYSPPGISLLATVASGIALPGESVLHFSPDNTHWEDEGLVSNLKKLPFHDDQVNPVIPIVGLNIDIPLSSEFDLVAKGGFGTGELHAHFAGAAGNYVFSGWLQQQVYNLALRYMPNTTHHLYFIGGPQYAKYQIKDIVLARDQVKIRPTADIESYLLSLMTGIGMKFNLGNLGALEIGAEFGSHHSFGIQGVAKINLTSLYHYIRKDQP